MIVKEKGKYKLLEGITVSNAASIGAIPKGTILHITQIDSIHHKVIGPDLFDWKFWDLPVEKV